MTAPNRSHRRELERELRELPAPPPPAGLLDAIRAEIPADLAPANDAGESGAGDGAGARAPWHRRPIARLAASLAVVAVGLALALRVAERQPAAEAANPASSSKAVVRETAPLPAPAPPVAAQEETLNRQVGEKKEEEDSAEKKDPTPLLLDATATPELREDAAATLPSTESLSSSSPSSPPAHGVRAESADVGQAAAAAPTPADAGAARSHENQPPAPLDDLGYLARPQQRQRAAERPLRKSSGTAAESGAAESGQTAETETITVVGEATGIDTSSSATETTIVPGLPSTGGRREPNEQPAGDMFFRPVDRNPFVDAEEDPLSTFALDVDTGSWTLARAYLGRGALPPREAIRVEEFVNAQSYGDRAPRRGDFTLVAEGAPSPFAPTGEHGDYRLLRFAIKAREIERAARRPAVLTFVVDVSGSMARENRLGLVRRALALLLDELGPEDRVALVVYGTRGRVVLRHSRDLEAIHEAIDALVPEGSTNAEEGLRLGYDLAAEAYRSGAANRVVLCSDGVANVGATGPESILGRIGREARRGIELTTVGFGMGNYNDALLEQLADQGDGRYHYVDTLDEARRIFVENLTGTLESVARDAKVQVEFDPDTVERWRLLGYENRDVADRDFRDDRVDAGEIGPGHTAVALYEVRLAERARGADRLGTLRLRWRSAATGHVEEAALELSVRDLESSFAHAGADLRRAAVAAELAERLADSFYAREGSWRALVGEAERLERGGELAELVRRAAELAEPSERPRFPGPADDDEPR